MLTILDDRRPDARDLERDLRAAIRGDVHFEDAYRAMYSTDAANYRQVPAGVVLPKDCDDAQAAMIVCSRHGVPVTPRGGGTSLSGASCNFGVIFDYSKYVNRILEIDPARKIARVEPGVVLDDLRALAERSGLTFGPAPSTHNRCAIGGMFGNNSCGIPAQFAGRMEENVLEAEILLYDGTRLRVGPTDDAAFEAIAREGGRKAEIYASLRALRDRYAGAVRARYPQIPRRVSGYNLNELLGENGFNVARALIGSEGTIVHVLELTLRLVPNPQATALAILGFEDIAAAGDHVAACNEHLPHSLEGMDETLFRHMQLKGKNPHQQHELFPGGHAWLVTQFAGQSLDEARQKAENLCRRARDEMPAVRGSRTVCDQHAMREIFEIRESGLGVNAKLPAQPEYYPGWEDAAVAPRHLGPYLREFRQKMDEYGYKASIYGHFGQGCVHCRIDFDLFTKEGIEKYRRFVHEMAHVVVRYEGSISGEHGDGQARGELLAIMYGEELVRAFWEFKTIFDPSNRMNPGKVVRPYRLDEYLRWGTHYDPWDPPTKFAFEEDRHSFAYAANRCVGAGVCRKHDKGTMCPSYMVSKEERYSTRGRARLLFEMLQGGPMKDGWRSEAVRESLDFCLACKGCKSECPVNVDMAAYKAEFLHHYYKGRMRPLRMWLFGFMFAWAQLASFAPGIANFFSQAPPFDAILKRLASIAPQRRIPMFAAQTFRAWFGRRTKRNTAGPRVILWVDTWNNYFKPETARAAVEVLEDAGYRVTIPPRQICCGRPLYDYGLLNEAERHVRAILEDLRAPIREGVPVVGLEPSCLSVLKDEIKQLAPGDTDARRLAEQCYDFETFMDERAGHYRPPQLQRRAIVHEHCHKKAVLAASSESHVFDRMDLDHEMLDSGCCGMAGAFGYEADHYDMSIACGERVLLPKVREAPQGTLVVADGFSCREQIEQCTGKRAMHPAEVMHLALSGSEPARPNSDALRRRILKRGYAVLALGAAALAGAAAVRALRR